MKKNNMDDYNFDFMDFLVSAFILLLIFMTVFGFAGLAGG